MKPLQHLKQLVKEDMVKKYPNVPLHALPINTFNTVANKESKQLKRIEKFFDLMPKAKMQRIDNKGIMMPGETKKYDFHTGKQTTGKMKFRPSNIQNGTSDMIGMVNGRFVAMELKRTYKNGKDRQSQVQKDYQREVEEAGGLYIIVDSFEDAYKWYFNFTK